MAALGKWFKAEQIVNLLREVDVDDDQRPVVAGGLQADWDQWLKAIGIKTAYIEPGSPWENGYCESLNGTLRDNLLNGEIFYGVREAQVIVNQWVRHYYTTRPHSSLGYKPPAPEIGLPAQPQKLHSALH
jgi:putative transposase